jgi:tRNA pseudouridine55 synthase
MSRDRGAPEPAGVLVVDKPSGLTSFGVVAAVRRALHVRRVGHTGTLDPLATGVLPVCVGEATKLVPFLLGADKRYRATLRLGVATDTLDAEGQVVRTDPPERVAEVDPAAFAAVLPRFTGPITQRPPAFSAIKVDGVRLHERARAGEAVEAPERDVVIHELCLHDATPPDFTIEVHCSKGTYVRSLAADLGEALGLSAHLTALRRLAAGPFTLADAHPLEALRDGDAARRALLSPTRALSHLPLLRLTGRALDDVRHGRRHTFRDASPGICRAVDADERLVALLDIGPDGVARVLRGFAAPPA